MDRIVISDLLVRCIIGVRDDERREKQDVLINLTLDVDLRKAGESDRIEDSVDYRAINKQIMSMAENSQFYLVEALAQSVADICLAHPEVAEARVRVEKPAALRFARSVGVEITRKQPG
ncbi:MAG TPA: dihydroneopterin aldolase [Nitrospirota bacterium]|nr:dihydroneopterin aldolase [Nitrospirota bacterium]